MPADLISFCAQLTSGRFSFCLSFGLYSRFCFITTERITGYLALLIPDQFFFFGSILHTFVCFQLLFLELFIDRFARPAYTHLFFYCTTRRLTVGVWRRKIEND